MDALDLDIDLSLADGGDTITVGDVTVPCMFHQYTTVAGETPMVAGQAMAQHYVLVRTSAFPDLADGDEVAIVRGGDTANPFNYLASSGLAIQDGRVTQLWLKQT